LEIVKERDNNGDVWNKERVKTVEIISATRAKQQYQNNATTKAICTVMATNIRTFLNHVLD